jgi:hypothetical protein
MENLSHEKALSEVEKARKEGLDALVYNLK